MSRNAGSTLGHFFCFLFLFYNSKHKYILGFRRRTGQNNIVFGLFFKKKNVKDNVDLDHVILKEQTQQRRFGLKKNKKKENSCHSPSIAVQLITGG